MVSEKDLDDVDPDGLMQWIVVCSWVNAEKYVRWSERAEPGADKARDRQRRDAATLKAEERLGKCPSKMRKAARQEWIDFASTVYALMLKIEKAGGWQLHDEQVPP